MKMEKSCIKESMGSKQNNWDVTPLLVSKNYNYIPRLMEVISKEHASSDVNLKHK